MRTAHAVIAAATLATALAGCSSSSSTTSPTSEKPPSSPAASSVASSVATPCDEAAITPAITTAIGADQALRQVNGLTCKDGWAVVFPTIGPPEGSTDGEIDITLVFKDESGTWVEQDRSAVCGTLPTGDASPSYPSDAQVPQELWQGACQTN